MVCQLVCVGMAVVVGGGGGEHLAVLMGGHRLGLPEVGSHGRHKKDMCSLFATRTREGQTTRKGLRSESGKEGGQRQVTGYRQQPQPTIQAAKQTSGQSFKQDVLPSFTRLGR